MNKTIMINGQEAALLVPEIKGQLAVVHLPTIKRLASLLPKASLTTIVEEMQVKIANASSLADYAQILEEELAFHQSINLITEWIPSV
jgi:hypothetical protein